MPASVEMENFPDYCVCVNYTGSLPGNCNGLETSVPFWHCLCNNVPLSTHSQIVTGILHITTCQRHKNRKGLFLATWAINGVLHMVKNIHSCLPAFYPPQTFPLRDTCQGLYSPVTLTRLLCLLYCRQWSDIPLGAHSAVEASDNRRAPLARGNAKMCSFSEMWFNSVMWNYKKLRM